METCAHESETCQPFGYNPNWFFSSLLLQFNTTILNLETNATKKYAQPHKYENPIEQQFNQNIGKKKIEFHMPNVSLFDENLQLFFYCQVWVCLKYYNRVDTIKWN